MGGWGGEEGRSEEKARNGSVRSRGGGGCNGGRIGDEGERIWQQRESIGGCRE